MTKSVLLILCIVLLIELVGCGRKDNVDNPETKTLQVQIDRDSVEQIDLYWNYHSYSVWREDNGSLIDNAIELLNGEYVVYAHWINNGTGSGDHITFYDAEGVLLKSYYIFRNEGGPFCIWEEGTEHFNYQREDNQSKLQEIVKMIAVEQYWIKTP